jgi:hypothetical protein
MSDVGAQESKVKFVSIEAETEAMEKAVGNAIGERLEKLVKAGADIVFYHSAEEFLKAREIDPDSADHSCSAHGKTGQSFSSILEGLNNPSRWSSPSRAKTTGIAPQQAYPGRGL